MPAAAFRPTGPAEAAASAPSLELVSQHLLKSLIVHRNQDEVRRLATDLESKASASHLDAYRRAPASRRAAGRDSLTILRANHKRRLLVARNHDHAGGSRLECFPGIDLSGVAMICRITAAASLSRSSYLSLVILGPSRNSPCHHGQSTQHCRHSLHHLHYFSLCILDSTPGGSTNQLISNIL